MSTDLDLARRLADVAAALRDEVGKVVVGQRAVVDQVLTAVFARGHCLVQGVPGLAKTLLVSTLARAIDGRFSRIQFTPDLMPGDVTGTDILQEDEATGRRRFEFQPGPVFANLLLADEVNRAPAQGPGGAAAGDGRAAGDRGVPHVRPARPVLRHGDAEPDRAGGDVPAARGAAGPVHVHGVGRLPAAGRGAGRAAADDRSGGGRGAAGRVDGRTGRAPTGRASSADQRRGVRVRGGRGAGDARPQDPAAGDFVRHWLRWGAGTRAAQDLIVASKARAVMAGRLHVTPDDIATVAPAVLRHRLIPTFNADAEGVTVEQVIEKVITLVPRGSAERLL